MKNIKKFNEKFSEDIDISLINIKSQIDSLNSSIDNISNSDNFYEKLESEEYDDLLSSISRLENKLSSISGELERRYLEKEGYD